MSKRKNVAIPGKILMDTNDGIKTSAIVAKFTSYGLDQFMPFYLLELPPLPIIGSR